MYILKNAWRSISRAKVRNILIGVIVLVIATSSCVFLLPNISPSFPRMGAQAAVDIACARAVHVVLL